MSGDTTPTVEFVTVTPELYESEKYAELAAASLVNAAVFVANGAAHDVPIVPLVALTVNVPALTVSPIPVTSEVALFAARLNVPLAVLS